MKIEFLYFDGCPNADAARENLKNALQQLGLPYKWDEINLNSSNVPDTLKSYGSPTVLVDGKDINGAVDSSGSSNCRLYLTEKGFLGAPPVETITSSIKRILDKTGVDKPR